MRGRSRTKLNIPICVACILLCLTLFSLHLCGGLYAKYIASISGFDSARVIQFGSITIKESGDFNDENRQVNIIPGVNLKKRAVVEFSGSEAATHVFVEILPEGWQTTDNKNFSIQYAGTDVLTWGIEDGWSFLTKNGETYVYYCTLEPNVVLEKDVIAGEGLIKVSENITKSQMQSLTDVSISFRATVVQLGGFENVTAAWESIAAKGGLT